MRRFLVKYTASFHGAGENDKDSIANGQYAVNDDIRTCISGKLDTVRTATVPIDDAWVRLYRTPISSNVWQFSSLYL